MHKIDDFTYREVEFEEDNETIKKFVDLCNQKKIEEAYNIITPECRDILYPNVETFINLYYNTIFKTPKLFSLQAWINADDYMIYKISYVDDVLATGNYTDGNKFDDFVTVRKDSNKISINKYIGRQEIFKEAETDELEILVKTKEVFLENERYVIEVTNKTEKEILLDSMNNVSSNVLLILQSGSAVGVNKYSVNLIDMLVHSKSTKEIILEFRNSFGTNYTGAKLKFKDIILDRFKYIEDKKNYQDRKSISISF